MNSYYQYIFLFVLLYISLTLIIKLLFKKKKNKHKIYNLKILKYISIILIITFITKYIVNLDIRISLIYIIPTIIIIVLYRIIKRPLNILNKRKLKRKLIRMNPYKFEEFCANMYKLLGHRVQVTPKSNDGGKDVIIDNNTYVECKHYKGSVGRPIIQKLCGVMVGDHIKNGIVVTTGHFSHEALEYAKKVNIQCIDFNGIIRLCIKIGKRIMRYI